MPEESSSGHQGRRGAALGEEKAASELGAEACRDPLQLVSNHFWHTLTQQV